MSFSLLNLHFFNLVTEDSMYTIFLCRLGVQKSCKVNLKDLITSRTYLMQIQDPLLMNRLSHPYHLDESTFNFREIKSSSFIFVSFFEENHTSKQNSPRWDAVFCGVASGAILFANVP